MHTSISLNLNSLDKASFRRDLITQFLQEKPGSINFVTEYFYYVETLQDGNRIYLKRPTSLNKGVDFEVRVENTQFRYGKYHNIISTGNRPSHNDIINDLKSKKAENLLEFSRMRLLLDKTYNCDPITKEEYSSYTFSSGYSVELIFKSLKWLFIEQDVTYWNRSGRAMLYGGISSIWE